MIEIKNNQFPYFNIYAAYHRAFRRQMLQVKKAAIVSIKFKFNNANLLALLNLHFIQTIAASFTYNIDNPRLGDDRWCQILPCLALAVTVFPHCSPHLGRPSGPPHRLQWFPTISVPCPTFLSHISSCPPSINCSVWYNNIRFFFYKI